MNKSVLILMLTIGTCLANASILMQTKNPGETINAETTENEDSQIRANYENNKKTSINNYGHDYSSMIWREVDHVFVDSSNENDSQKQYAFPFNESIENIKKAVSEKSLAKTLNVGKQPKGAYMLKGSIGYITNNEMIYGNKKVGLTEIPVPPNMMSYFENGSIYQTYLVKTGENFSAYPIEQDGLSLETICSEMEKEISNFYSNQIAEKHYADGDLNVEIYKGYEDSFYCDSTYIKLKETDGLKLNILEETKSCVHEVYISKPDGSQEMLIENKKFYNAGFYSIHERLYNGSIYTDNISWNAQIVDTNDQGNNYYVQNDGSDVFTSVDLIIKNTKNHLKQKDAICNPILGFYNNYSKNNENRLDFVDTAGNKSISYPSTICFNQAGQYTIKNRNSFSTFNYTFYVDTEGIKHIVDSKTNNNKLILNFQNAYHSTTTWKIHQLKQEKALSKIVNVEDISFSILSKDDIEYLKSDDSIVKQGDLNDFSTSDYGIYYIVGRNDDYNYDYTALFSYNYAVPTIETLTCETKPSLKEDGIDVEKGNEKELCFKVAPFVQGATQYSAYIEFYGSTIEKGSDKIFDIANETFKVKLVPTNSEKGNTTVIITIIDNLHGNTINYAFNVNVVDPKAKEIEFIGDKPTFSQMFVGETYTYNCIVKDTNDKYYCSQDYKVESSVPDVIKVKNDNHTIVASNKGNSIITLRANDGVSMSFPKISVKDSSDLQITFDGELKAEPTYKLDKKRVVLNTNEVEREFTFESSNSDVIRIENNNEAHIIKAGSSTITAKVKIGEETLVTSKKMVVQAPQVLEIKLDTTCINMFVGENSRVIYPTLTFDTEYENLEDEVKEKNKDLFENGEFKFEITDENVISLNQGNNTLLAKQMGFSNVKVSSIKYPNLNTKTIPVNVAYNILPAYYQGIYFRFRDSFKDPEGEFISADSEDEKGIKQIEKYCFKNTIDFEFGFDKDYPTYMEGFYNEKLRLATCVEKLTDDELTEGIVDSSKLVSYNDFISIDKDKLIFNRFGFTSLFLVSDYSGIENKSIILRAYTIKCCLSTKSNETFYIADNKETGTAICLLNSESVHITDDVDIEYVSGDEVMNIEPVKSNLTSRNITNESTTITLNYKANGVGKYLVKVKNASYSEEIIVVGDMFKNLEYDIKFSKPNDQEELNIKGFDEEGNYRVKCSGGLILDNIPQGDGISYYMNGVKISYDQIAPTLLQEGTYKLEITKYSDLQDKYYDVLSDEYADINDAYKSSLVSSSTLLYEFTITQSKVVIQSKEKLVFIIMISIVGALLVAAIILLIVKIRKKQSLKK